MAKKDLKKIEWETTVTLEEKGFTWYFVFFVVVIGLIVFALLQKNFLFVFLIVLGSILILFNNKDDRKKIKCELYDDEFLINGRENVYKYDELLGFSIVERSGSSYFLVLHTKNRLMPYVKVYFPKSKKEDIENFLKGRLKQVEYEESLIDVLLERLKF